MVQDWTDDIPDKNDQVFTNLGDVDTNLMTLKTSFLGTSAPSSSEEGLFWADGTPPARPQPKLRDDADYEELSYLDGWKNRNWTINNVSDASTFEIDSEVETILAPNDVNARMLKIVQPTNGTVYAPVESASASSGTTTVNIGPRRTKDLDSGEGVDEIYHGESRPDEQTDLPLITYDRQKTQGQLTAQSPVLDLTTTASVDILPQNLIDAGRGGDNVLLLVARAYVTTAIVADNTAPVVEIQAGSGTVLMKIDTFADGDPENKLRKADDDSDGTTLEKHDLTADKIQAKTVTAAADSGTADGEIKIKLTVEPLE